MNAREPDLMMLNRLRRQTVSALLVSFLITGCGAEPQCNSDSDCLSDAPCTEGSCDAGICKTTILDDCCGNGLCDTSVENECTCVEDCGVCGGHISYITENGETQEARYLKLRCNEAKICSVAYDQEEQVYTKEFHALPLDGMIFNAVVEYPNPLEARKDTIVVDVELVEKTDPLITYPINVTSALALDGVQLFGRSLDVGQFRALGDHVDISIPIETLVKLPEESHQLELQLSLEYGHLIEKQRIDNGLLVYDQYGRPVIQTVRDGRQRSTLVVGVEQDVTIMSLQSAMMHRLNP